MSAWQNHRQTTVRAATKLQATEKPESLAGKFPNQLTVTVQLYEMEVKARLSTRLRFHIPQRIEEEVCPLVSESHTYSKVLTVLHAVDVSCSPFLC